jgi:ornithine cyclodeaminase
MAPIVARYSAGMAAGSWLDAESTAAALPYPALADEIEQLLCDDNVLVPPRLVQPLPGGGSLFVMPALDGRVAITKLITYTPANAGSGRATIQGDVIVFDIASGARLLLLDGPTVTARRTAAVTLLAARRLAGNPTGPLLIVGAGAQARSHLEALTQGLGVRRVVIASRTLGGAEVLAQHARRLGLQASVTGDPDSALAECPLVVTCTPARAVVLREIPRNDAFVAAVGAFTPAMVELGAQLCRHFAERGSIVLDTPDAQHEAGDLLQAGLAVARYRSLSDVVRRGPMRSDGPLLFKSCGWAGWDLAAARLATR